MSARWLSTLVRARQLQEDAAQQQLANANRRAQRAHARVRYDDDRLDALCAEDAAKAVPAFVAAAVALQAAAATHSAAIASAGQADADIEDTRTSLTAAARARHTAEQLQDRELDLEAGRAAAVQQRGLDEIAASIHRRNAERTP